MLNKKLKGSVAEPEPEAPRRPMGGPFGGGGGGMSMLDEIKAKKAKKAAAEAGSACDAPAPAPAPASVSEPAADADAPPAPRKMAGGPFGGGGGRVIPRSNQECSQKAKRP